MTSSSHSRPLELQVYGYDWAEHTFRSLQWLYGRERALGIVRGQDAAIKADVKAWRRFGIGRTT